MKLSFYLLFSYNEANASLCVCSRHLRFMDDLNSWRCLNDLIMISALLKCLARKMRRNKSNANGLNLEVKWFVLGLVASYQRSTVTVHAIFSIKLTICRQKVSSTLKHRLTKNVIHRLFISVCNRMIFIRNAFIIAHPVHFVFIPMLKTNTALSANQTNSKTAPLPLFSSIYSE